MGPVWSVLWRAGVVFGAYCGGEELLTWLRRRRRRRDLEVITRARRYFRPGDSDQQISAALDRAEEELSAERFGEVGRRIARTHARHANTLPAPATDDAPDEEEPPPPPEKPADRWSTLELEP